MSGESDDNGSDDEPKKNLNIEIPSEDAESGVQYAPAQLPIGQYDILDSIKEDYGLTWRGLLMVARRDLDGEIPDGSDQYSAINETRKYHGLTWRGMLIHAVRVLGEDERFESSSDCPG